MWATFFISWIFIKYWIFNIHSFNIHLCFIKDLGKALIGQSNDNEHITADSDTWDQYFNSAGQNFCTVQKSDLVCLNVALHPVETVWTVQAAWSPSTRTQKWCFEHDELPPGQVTYFQFSSLLTYKGIKKLDCVAPLNFTNVISPNNQSNRLQH